jgi:hypothetical protein
MWSKVFAHHLHGGREENHKKPIMTACIYGTSQVKGAPASNTLFNDEQCLKKPSAVKCKCASRVTKTVPQIAVFISAWEHYYKKWP